MSVNSVIINAVAPITGICRPDIYDGDSKTYAVFNYDVLGDMFADDAPDVQRYLVQVHYYCPHKINSLSTRENIKKALFQSGFTWPYETNATDNTGQHFVFECEIVEGVDLDGEA